MTDCICVNTLGELATYPIPTGTQSAMVQQFNSASAVSSALYITVSSNPNHPLSIQSPGGPNAPWWTIHPDYISLEAAGAPPVGGDCAPAMQNVLAYFLVVGRVVLKLWERDYILNSLSVVRPTAPANAGLSIIGRGQSVSRLVVPYPTNTAGALSVIFQDAKSQFLLRDFSVIASGGTSLQTGSSGTAIQMKFAIVVVPGFPPTERYCGIVENIHIGPELDSKGDGWSYFGTALDLTGAPQPTVFNSTITGCWGSPAHDNYADNSPRYFAQTLLVLDECYAPQVLGCNLANATMGVSYVCAEHQVQGFLFGDTAMAGVQTGFYARHNSECPDGQFRNTSVQFRNIGFDMGNIAKWRFTGGTYRVEGTEALVYDMRFLAADTVTVAVNTFESNLSGLNNARVNIYIDANTQVNGVNHGKNFLIDTNIFGDHADVTVATSAIQATVSATNIQIGASNAFNGQFSGSIVNDESGTAAVTPAGFPTTNASGSAVVPNGNATVGIPTLGSANVPWPASFSVASLSQAHTLPQASVPTTPATGWVLYTDHSDRNKLKARYQDGTTIITLATPP